MTRPRSQLVSLDATPYYHCISRCVRRAFLCGQDQYSGKSFDHRKPWLMERLSLLTDIFAIDIAAYAIMSNHYHLVLHIDQHKANIWTRDEVLARWTRLYKGPTLIQRFKAGEALSRAELDMVDVLVSHFRRQLGNISRFMACLNEYIARKANLEDGCTGRFWEGRFKSQALLDESALLSCMAYVDLNPIRAGLADHLDTSDFTSIQARIGQIRDKMTTAKVKAKRCSKRYQQPRLLPLHELLTNKPDFTALPFNLKDYLELTDWTGRSIRSDKKGHIQTTTPKLLSVLNLTESQWRVLALDIQKQSILMLNGLDTLATIEKKAKKLKAA